MSDRPLPAARRAARPGGAHESQFRLLRERRFAPFFWTQFLGAMNDNVFKIGFTSLVTFQAARFSGVDANTAAFLISAVFILPFVLFSATSGQIADKYDKAMLTRFVKTFEIGVMLVGGAGFWLHSAPLLYLCTFLMGVHSTLFGPVKYAYLPQYLSEAELVGGNGLVEMGTFVAILLGTIVGGAAAGLGGAWRDDSRGRLRRDCVDRTHRVGVRAGFDAGAAVSADQLESGQRNVAQPEARARKSHGVFEPARHFVAVVRRRDVPVVVFSASRRMCCQRIRMSSHCCSRRFRWVSASVRCCASGFRSGASKSASCRSARSA